MLHVGPFECWVWGGVRCLVLAGGFFGRRCRDAGRVVANQFVVGRVGRCDGTGADVASVLAMSPLQRHGW